MRTLQNDFTTLEQSKKLLELGVPADSADCIFTRFSRDEKWKRRFIEDVVSTQLFCDQDFYLPCWSVGRLIEVLEKSWNSTFPIYCDIIGENDKVLYVIETIQHFANHSMLDFSKLEE